MKPETRRVIGYRAWRLIRIRPGHEQREWLPWRQGRSDHFVPLAWGEPDDPANGQLRIMGAAGHVWLPSALEEASCTRGLDHVVDEACQCGLYARHERVTASLSGGHILVTANRAANSVWCVGTVQVSGKVIEGDHGLRAQHARLLELAVPFGARKLRSELEQTYHVDVAVMAP